MAEDPGRREQVVLDLLEIGVTDAAAFHLNQQFAGANSGGGHLLHRYPAVAGVNRGSHGRGRGGYFRIESRQENLPALEQRASS